MNSETALVNFLGFGARARKLGYGQAKCMADVRSGTAQLIILDGSVSDGTRKAFVDSCRSHHVPWILLEGQDVLGPGVGKAGCRIADVKDPGFARSVLEKFGAMSGKGTG